MKTAQVSAPARRNLKSRHDFTIHVPIWHFIFQEYADQLGIPFLETSAKNATNVEQVQKFKTFAYVTDAGAG